MPSYLFTKTDTSVGLIDKKSLKLIYEHNFDGKIKSIALSPDERFLFVLVAAKIEEWENASKKLGRLMWGAKIIKQS